MLHDSNSQPAISLSPKASFFLGISAGVLVIFSVGFFILLGIIMSGDSRLALADNSGAAPSAAQPAAVAPQPTVVGDPAPVSKTDHIRGDANAKVTLIEYSDFQCPYCSKFKATVDQLLKDYQGKIRLVYRHYPLSFHPQAMPAANAAECASEQGKFFEYHDQLFANQEALSDAKYGEIADLLKLNRKQFDNCYSSKKYQARIDADQAGGNTAGVSGTPATFVLGAKGSKQLIEGAQAYANAKAIIDAALQN